MISKNDVSIIIPHFLIERTDWALDQCLLSLENSEFPIQNIVIAHNGSTPQLGLQEKYPGIKEIFVFEQGQCKAVNAGVAITNTPWVMISNNDMVYPSDWFERLTLPLTNNQTEGHLTFDCVSPQLIEPQAGAPTFKTVFFGGVGGDFNRDGFMEYAKTHKGAVIRSGFNLPFLLRRSIWDTVGGYDINYDPWSSNSDSDLEYKLKLAGINMWQNADCPVYHFSQTSGTFHPSRSSYWSKNWDYFIEKWGFPRTDEGIWEATFKIPYDKLKYKPKWVVIPEEKDF